MKNIYILGIETSCDETSAAIVKNGRYVLANIISSQINIHKKFGGVVPEIAARKHLEIISQVINQTLKIANLEFKNLDAIAVTQGPGLVGALLTGISYAKSLAFCLNKKLIAVNHIAGHICANYLENNFEPPFVCCTVSGGHTSLIYTSDYNNFELLGHTLDDAAGETYDKISRVLNLGYPGGPEIEKLARMGNRLAIKFPKALLLNNNLDFSFSGLKSNIINFIYKHKNNLTCELIQDIAASFEYTIGEILIQKAFKACEIKSCTRISLCGGVAANLYLRDLFKTHAREKKYLLNIPKNIFCTDNAAMIASSAYYKYLENKFSLLDLNAQPNLKLE